MIDAAFCAGELNRAAHLRGQAPELLATQTARVLPLWQLKPLIAKTGGLKLLPWTHEIFAQAEAPMFLGLCPEGAPLFAADVSYVDVEDMEEAEVGGGFGAFIDPSQKSTPLVAGAVFCDLKAAMLDLPALDAEIGATARAILGWHKSHKFCSSCGTQSEAATGGWQRNCPACQTPHCPRTDPVVIMLITHGNSVLLGRNVNFPEGLYSLLAGFVEPGEPIEAAVRREVLEESGVVVGDVSYVASQPWPFPATLMIGCTGVAVTQDITIDACELEDAMWLSREEVSDIMSGARSDIMLARKASIAHFLLTKWLADI
jgi:NAD+ diphosphatase